jgi:hypothetical protein
MRTPLLVPSLTGVLALAAAWGGYLWGKAPPPARKMLEAKSAILGETPRDLSRSTAEGKRESLETGIRRLMEMKPGDVMGAANQLPAWEFVRSLTLAEVQQALRITGLEGDPVLASMLYSRWAELDPAAAMDSLAGPARKQAWGLGQNALWLWVKSDPAAAYRWYQKNRELAGELRFVSKMVDTLMAEPPASAIAKATVLGEDFRKEAAKLIGTRMADTAEAREAFLQLAATLPEQDRADAIARMMLEWGKHEPVAVLRSLERIADPGKRESMRDDVVDSWSSRDPAGLQEWLHEHPQAADLNKRAELWQGWATERPEDAIRWLAAHGNPPEMAVVVVHRIQSAIQGRPIPLSVGQAANEQAAIRANYLTWSAADPDEAARWLQATDPKTRAVLDPSSTPEKP